MWIFIGVYLKYRKVHKLQVYILTDFYKSCNQHPDTQIKKNRIKTLERPPHTYFQLQFHPISMETPISMEIKHTFKYVNID